MCELKADSLSYCILCWYYCPPKIAHVSLEIAAQCVVMLDLITLCWYIHMHYVFDCPTIAFAVVLATESSPFLFIFFLFESRASLSRITGQKLVVV